MKVTNIKSLIRKRKAIKDRYKMVEFTEMNDYEGKLNKMYRKYPRKEAEKLILKQMYDERFKVRWVGA